MFIRPPVHSFVSANYLNPGFSGNKSIIISVLQLCEKIKPLKYIINALKIFVFTRLYLRVFADPDECIRSLKRNVILRTAKIQCADLTAKS